MKDINTIYSEISHRDDSILDKEIPDPLNYFREMIDSTHSQEKDGEVILGDKIVADSFKSNFL